MVVDSFLKQTRMEISKDFNREGIVETSKSVLSFDANPSVFTTNKLSSISETYITTKSSSSMIINSVRATSPKSVSSNSTIITVHSSDSIHKESPTIPSLSNTALTSIQNTMPRVSPIIDLCTSSSLQNNLTTHTIDTGKKISFTIKSTRNITSTMNTTKIISSALNITSTINSNPKSSKSITSTIKPTKSISSSSITSSSVDTKSISAPNIIPKPTITNSKALNNSKKVSSIDKPNHTKTTSNIIYPKHTGLERLSSLIEKKIIESVGIKMCLDVVEEDLDKDIEYDTEKDRKKDKEKEKERDIREVKERVFEKEGKEKYISRKSSSMVENNNNNIVNIESRNTTKNKADTVKPHIAVSKAVIIPPTSSSTNKPIIISPSSSSTSTHLSHLHHHHEDMNLLIKMGKERLVRSQRALEKKLLTHKLHQLNLLKNSERFGK